MSHKPQARTVQEILATKSNPATNPLGIAVGRSISFDQEDISGIDFVVKKIITLRAFASQTVLATDYHLVGRNLIEPRLRICGQILQLFSSSPYEITKILGKDFWIERDDEGKNLDSPHHYWRVDDQDAPMRCVEHSIGDVQKPAVFWDYHRITYDGESKTKITEHLVIEKVEGECVMLRGHDVDSDKVYVIGG